MTVKQKEKQEQKKMYHKVEKIVNAAFKRSKESSSKETKSSTSLIFQ